MSWALARETDEDGETTAWVLKNSATDPEAEEVARWRGGEPNFRQALEDALARFPECSQPVAYYLPDHDEWWIRDPYDF